MAQEALSTKKLPLVYDPSTKKYFIGGSSKFVLKQGEASSLIERIEVSVDAGEYRPYNEAIVFKEEGKHALKFRAVNPVNNWSPVQFVEVFADLTAPTIEAKVSEDHFYKEGETQYVGMRSSITLSAQDNLSGVESIEASWDGKTFFPYLKPLEADKPGQYTLFYRCTDRVGNATPAKPFNYVVDGTSPESKLVLSNQARMTIMNGKKYLSDAVAYSIESADGESKVKETWVSVDDAKPQLYLKPIYLLSEGPHKLNYYSIDRVGNKEDLKTFSVYTVAIPPKTAAVPIGKQINTGGINFAKRDFQLKLETTENVVGIERVEVKTDGDADFKPYIEPLRFSQPGLHTVTYRSMDRAGNIEPAKVYNVHITEISPETTMATAQPLVVRDGVTYSSAPNVLTFNVSNSNVGVKQTMVSVDDAPFAPYQGPLTLNADKKVHKIAYKSVDKLDNEETVKTVSFHMIGNVPVLDLFLSDGKSSEEQLRTDYLEQPGSNGAAPDAAPKKREERAPASAK